MALSGQLSRLGKQSAIYGLGGLVSRILAVLLLPLYTRYLSTGDYGEIETLIALVTVLTIILRFGISSAFFRFYFDADDHDGRRLVLRTSFWFTMTMATLGLVARRRARGADLRLAVRRPRLGEPRARERRRALGADELRADDLALPGRGAVGRIRDREPHERRPDDRGARVLLVVVLEKGPLGVIVGNFTGTLIVYLALLGYRREQLGLQMDRGLLRRMNHFGLPLVPSALLPLDDELQRPLLPRQAHRHERGRALLRRRARRVGDGAPADRVPHRLAGVRLLDQERRGGEAHVRVGPHLPRRPLDLGRDGSGAALAVARRLARRIRSSRARPASSARSRSPRSRSPASSSSRSASGGRKRTQFNWVITGVAAVVNVTLNLTLIPIYGMMGAAIATVAAYTVMFVGMAWWAQRIFPCPYQWRRVLTAAAVGVALATLGKVVGAGLPLCVGLIVLYPLALLPARLLPARRAEEAALARRPRLSV